MTDNSNYNTQRIQAFQRAMERKLRGETEDLGQWFCEDILWHFPRSTAEVASGCEHRGKAAVLAMLGTDVDQFYQPDSIRFDYHHFTAQDDRVHMHYSLHALTSNGREYHNDYQSLFRLRDGLIAEVWEYFDTAYLFSLFDG